MSLKSGSAAAKSIRSGASGRTGPTAGGQTYADRKAQALSAKNTSVLTYDDLERIKGMCSQTNEQEDYINMRQSERQTLQQISNARVSKWPNTIQAQRERKEAERIKKLEDDEVSIRPFTISAALSCAWPEFILKNIGYLKLTYFKLDRTQKNRRPRRGLPAVFAPGPNRQGKQDVP